ncbi:MAG: RsmB/NOP family class I SAM-dependent RNA methyltransferase [Candidatus Bathyarchaeota archaeon]|nr:RsmB/NOP family class I SAM-dependent RNA methyltransferase [Candidatus Bathyarchaeota archaeon]
MGAGLFLDRYRAMGHDLRGDERTRRAIRVNTLLARVEEVVAKLAARGAKLTPIPWLRDGLYIEGGESSAGSSFEYLLGLYAMQEAAAQFPVEVLAPAAGEVVLDMCAAPGGKTAQAAAWMGNKGTIVSVDVKRDRLYALENNLERLGVENCVAYCADAVELDYGGTLFDRVLLDAPCSGNYVTDREWFRKRDIGDVEKNSLEQRRLLGAAVGLLKQGGTLVYTTCSLEPEEDELNVQWLLENHDVKVEEVGGPGSPALTEVLGRSLSPEIAKCRRFWPDETGTQGFFVAKVVKP